LKQIVILSGKGGTGKTTLAGALVHLLEQKAFADCDVDAPNLHLICSELQETVTNDYYGFQKAEIDQEKCVQCGRCEELCKFGAIKDFKVNPYECEGCGVCEYFCPVRQDGISAIKMKEWISGETFLSQRKNEWFSHAKLQMGNGASGKLVTQVRKQLMEKITSEELVIIDGSPGIGCPVLASITGVDLVVAVTEPTLSGLHDLERLVQTVAQFKIPVFVCINKYDLNKELTQLVEDFCAKNQLEVLGKIPYDKTVIKAVNAGESIVLYPESQAAIAIVGICNKIKALI